MTNMFHVNILLPFDFLDTSKNSKLIQINEVSRKICWKYVFVHHTNYSFASRSPKPYSINSYFEKQDILLWDLDPDIHAEREQTVFNFTKASWEALVRKRGHKIPLS